MHHPTCIYWSNYYYLLFLTVLDMLHLLQGFVSNALFKFAIVMVARSKRFVPFCNSKNKSRLFHKHGSFGDNSYQSLFFIGVELTNNESVFFKSIYWLVLVRLKRGSRYNVNRGWYIGRRIGEHQWTSTKVLVYMLMLTNTLTDSKNKFSKVHIGSNCTVPVLNGPYLLLPLHSSQRKLHV